MRILKKEIWPHKVTIELDINNPIYPKEHWLGENLGAFKDRWNVVYFYNRTDFYFKSKSDAVEFALRWK